MDFFVRGGWLGVVEGLAFIKYGMATTVNICRASMCDSWLTLMIWNKYRYISLILRKQFTNI
jgi:hypothetical protein